MARYNTSLASATITGATTIGTPNSGAFTALTGSAPYTVTLPAPAAFPGSNQTFYNATSGIVTLSTPSGNFVGTGASGASTTSVFAGNVVSVTSDGTNYIVISEDGSAMTATTGAFSGNVTVQGTLTVQSSGGVSMAPSSAGNIDNVSIGASARSTGAFTTLAANAQVSLTANTASTSTSTGSLVVTGGIGVSGSVYTGGTVSATNLTATNVTGTLQTASQPNVTAIGPSNAVYITAGGLVGIGHASPSVPLHVVRTGGATNTPNTTLILDYEADSTSTAGGGTAIEFRGKSSGGNIANYSQARIRSVAYDTNNSHGIAFDTKPNAGTSLTETVRIDPSGRVGIGQPSPTVPLDVRNTTTGSAIRISVSDGSGSSDFGYSWYIDNTAHELAQINASYQDSAAGGRGDLAIKTRNYTASGGLTTKIYITGTGNVGINTTGPAAKLHVVASTPSGLPSVPDGTTAIVDSSGMNYLTFRNTVDNATNAGLAFQDNNIGGYVVFRNYDGTYPAISDRMHIAGYQGVNIQYGTANSIDVLARTNAATFDSTGIWWEKRKLIYSQDIPSGISWSANTWYRFSGFQFNGALDTGGSQPGFLVQISFANYNPSYGYISWVTAYIPPLSSNTYSGYQGGYTSSHYGGTSTINSLVFNSTHHTSPGANHDIRLRLDSPSSYDVMNLYIYSNTGISASSGMTFRVWKI